MDALGQSALMVAITSLSFGFSVLSKNARNLLFLSFAGVTTLISAWAFSFFLDRVWPGLGYYRYHLLLNGCLGPMSLIFIRVMVQVYDRTSAHLFLFSVVLAFSLSLAIIGRWDELPAVRLILYFSPGVVVLQTLWLLWTDRQLPRLQGPLSSFKRRHFIYLGALLVLGTSVMDHVALLGQVLPVLGNLGLIVYLFFLSQAVTQQRLLNLHALLSRFLVLLGVALTLTLIFLLLVVWTKENPALFFLNSFMASFFLLTLLEPLRSLVSYCTQQLLTKRHIQLVTLVRKAQMELNGVLDQDQWLSQIMDTIQQIFSPRSSAVFVLGGLGGEQTSYRCIRTQGEDACPCPEILAVHPLIDSVHELRARARFPILLDQVLENEMERAARRTPRERYGRLLQSLRALGGNMLIPLGGAAPLLGFIVINLPQPPERWGHNWSFLGFVLPYFEAAGSTLRSLEVYARHREKERLAALGEMAAGLAHEIRNPLGAIKGAAQYLDPSKPSDESRFLRIIIEEVDRLDQVVSDFLVYSKPALPGYAVLHLGELTERTIARMRLDSPPAMRFDLRIFDGELQLRGAAGPLEQVILNLLQNAKRAVRNCPLPVSIALELSREEGAKRWVVLRVRDPGEGIKAEHLPKIFIPFFTTFPQGTGLGLPISRNIVEAHGGTIEVASQEGVYTQFTLRLPALELSRWAL